MLIYIIQFYIAVEQYLKRLIHQRRLIIASEKKVMQFTVGVPVQLCIIFLMLGGVLWSSYATGRFLAAKSTLEAQSNTIRSVTNKQVNNMFSVLLPTSPLLKEHNKNLINIGGVIDTEEALEKMALLEQQLNELKNTTEAIVERVQIKTDDQIENLESIVRKTGINPASIKKQTGEIYKENKDNAEGGPYIPENMPKISDETSKMFDSLDDLQILRQAVANLPLSIPIKNGKEHSNFGHRIDPFNGDMAFHSGIDIAAPLASSVYSTADGTVISAGRNGSYGNMIDIDHGFGIVTRYGHLSKINVHKGDKVTKNEVIGVQGSTGRSTGAHLHYEVRFNGEPINPEKFLQTGKLLEIGSAVSQN